MDESIADTVDIDLGNEKTGAVKPGVSFFQKIAEKYKRNKEGRDKMKPKVFPGKM